MEYDFTKFLIMNISSSIVALVLLFIMVYYLYDFKTYNKKIIILAVIFLFVNNYGITWLTNLGENNIVTFTSHLSIILFEYGSTILFFALIFKAINIKIVNAVFMASFIGNFISQSTVGFLVNGWYEVDLSGEALYLLNYMILYPLGFCLVYKIMKHINFKKLFDQFFKHKLLTIVLTVTLILVSTTQLWINTFLPDIFDTSQHLIYIIQFSVLFTMFYLTAFHLVSKEKIISQNALISEQDYYLSTLVSIQKEMRLFQHDYKNMLSALYLLAETKQTDDIKNYIDDSLLDIDSKLINKINITANLSTIKITEVKNTILNHLEIIDDKKIDFNLTVYNNIDNDLLDISLLNNEFTHSFKQLVDTTNSNETMSLTLEVIDYVLYINLSNNKYQNTLKYSYKQNYYNNKGFVLARNEF